MNGHSKDTKAICVKCGGQLQRGTISLGQTEALNLLAGTVPPKMFFHTESEQKIQILGSSHIFFSTAHRCPMCSLVMFQGLRD